MDDPGEPRRPRGLRVAGVVVSMSPSGLLGVLLVAWLWTPAFALPGAPAGQRYVLAGVFAVALYASILAHEAAHAVAARAFGYPVSHIELWVFGGVTVYERTRPSPGREAVIAAAGPLTTLAVAGLAAAGAAGASGGDPRLHALLAALAWANALMAALNLLPGLPLDGGGVLKAAVWRATRSEGRGTVAAAWAGRALAVAALAVPLALAVADGTPDAALVLTGAVFGALLWSGAGDALRRERVLARVPGLRAAALGRPAVAVPADLPLDAALARAAGAAASGPLDLVVVDPAGRPVGLVHPAAAAAVPAPRRAHVPVAAVARTVAAGAVLPAGLAGEPLLTALRAHGGEEFVLVDGPDGRVSAVLARADVESALAGSR